MTAATTDQPGAPRVAIYDTTLRDGTQREGISLGCADKLRIAQQLDALGVDFIEGGWPGSNPKDVEFFRRARDVAWQHAAIAAFGSTRHAGVPADDDLGLAALIEARAPVCTLFGKSSLVHVTEVLRTTADENLRMIEDSVAWLVARGRRVVYDAEHFFDGARDDAAYAYETLRAAVRGGAEVVALCDTNGGTLPWEVEARVRDVIAAIGCPVGIHAHDDAGCGVASSLAAVRAGAGHVQGTINGYGERCGNANLTSILPGLALKLGRPCLLPGALAVVGRVARGVAEIANLALDEHAPYVGRSAFAHKGGVHVAAIRRSPRSYEHVDPALVGNRTRIVVSELSGRGNVLAKAEQFDVAIRPDAASSVLEQLKQREHGGYAFESAEASVALLMRREQPGYQPPFEIVDYKVLLGQREGHPAYAEAAIKLRVRGELHHTAAEGNGPVNAIDAALRKALAGAYPEIAAIRLDDYKVRILDGRDGTAAVTRVLIDHSSDREQWTTVGASPSILEASLTALADGIEHGLWLAAARPLQDGPHAVKGDRDERHEQRHDQRHDRPVAG
ncbi:MAG TPA: citramalate synthase [Kofleriaceae bacterium]|nr:citramalate synthase [Kofleriaceae bacterium]